YCSLEAIQNAVKHAGPDSSITVTVGRSGRRIEFEVADNGVGFWTDRHADGMGLVSMRDRIAAVDGELEVDSSPGRGTVVSGSVPVALEPVADSPERELGSCAERQLREDARDVRSGSSLGDRELDRDGLVRLA